MKDRMIIRDEMMAGLKSPSGLHSLHGKE